MSMLLFENKLSAGARLAPKNIDKSSLSLGTVLVYFYASTKDAFVVLVSSKNITCVDLVLNVVEDGIVAVGDDGL